MYRWKGDNKLLAKLGEHDELWTKQHLRNGAAVSFIAFRLLDANGRHRGGQLGFGLFGKCDVVQ